MNNFFSFFTLDIPLSEDAFSRIQAFFERHAVSFIIVLLSIISIANFIFYYHNGLGLAYNDTRLHLDIGRRVVEGLKPGLAQLGSVWLPLPHLLMVPTIWNDFMWHSGLAGALVSMISFVATGALIYLFLKELGVGILGRMIGVFVFVANLNVLYLQSTAMTELLLLATMTAGSYYLLLWYKNGSLLAFIASAFWIMLSTLVRYDGWFLFIFSIALIFFSVWRQRGYKTAEGMFVLFGTLAGFGVFLWLLWNFLIFKDPLYFIFGPYSAYAQQQQFETLGILTTKHHLLTSLKVYFYALAYNSGAFTLFLGILGGALLWFDRKISVPLRIAATVLLAPFFFNVLALYLGHSILFIQGISGTVWFNPRYGVMLMPTIAIFIGYLVTRAGIARWTIIGLLIFVTFFSFSSTDAVTIDDARVGASQKNVSEVSSWLHEHATETKGFILIAAASHDAIIFSSGLPMKRFIHEGTGDYWTRATSAPEQWVRWIVMRTSSDDDQTYRLLKDTPGLSYYNLVQSFPFADIYELKPEYLNNLIVDPVLGKQK